MNYITESLKEIMSELSEKFSSDERESIYRSIVFFTSKLNGVILDWDAFENSKEYKSEFDIVDIERNVVERYENSLNIVKSFADYGARVTGELFDEEEIFKDFQDDYGDVKDGYMKGVRSQVMAFALNIYDDNVRDYVLDRNIKMSVVVNDIMEKLDASDDLRDFVEERVNKYCVG